MIRYNLDSDFDRSYENGLHEECGIFGVYHHENASMLCYQGLLSLQHRGQEGAGIVCSDGQHIAGYRNEGLVGDIFDEEHLESIRGSYGIGHVRYATQGGGGLMNIQPFLFYHTTGDFALCHNGNLINALELKTKLEQAGALFQSTSDSEIIAHLIKRSSHTDMMDALCSSLKEVDGAFAYLLLSADTMYCARDKYGLRPVSLGKLDEGYVISSETCAFESIGATFIRDILPGEVIRIHNNQITSRFYDEPQPKALCSLEFIYFARPDSVIDQQSVYDVRKACGRYLAHETDFEADIVVGVPESSIPAALGYAQEKGLPFEMGFMKNPFSTRTFIQPTQSLREQGVKMKLSPIRSVIAGKRVVIIDDSIVRGTTLKYMVESLKDMGAREIHMLVASPPLIAPCFYGVDLPSDEDLIAANHSVSDIASMLEVTSLHYLSIEGLMSAAQHAGLCLAYFNNQYPTPLYSFAKQVREKEEQRS